MAKQSQVGLCIGKDCRKEDGYRLVDRELRTFCDVVAVACLDVCDGPVVVLDVRGDAPVVIERVRSRALVNALIDHVNTGAALTPRLRKRTLTGSKRAKARRRLNRKP